MLRLALNRADPLAQKCQFTLTASKEWSNSRICVKRIGAYYSHCLVVLRL